MPIVQPRCILLADDSQTQRQLMRAMLQDIPDVKLFEATDGSWALQLVRQLVKVDLIITDLNMPGMDGIELLRNLATHSDIPAVILISGYAPELLENCARAAQELGISRIAYLSKPFYGQTLKELALKLINTPLKPPFHADGEPAPMPLIDIITGLAHNQFCAYYQPIFSLKHGQLEQIEALARWENPQFGLLGPASFIERLDGEGHLTLLTRRIAQTGFDLLQTKMLPPHVRLSINLSRNQLDDTELLEWLHHELVLRNLSPNRVVLEITENSAFTNLGQTMATLLRLRLRGFGLALDDFGVGQTPLELLRELAITELKLDQSLVRNIHRDERAQSIFAGIVKIASELQLRIIAEGVENEADFHFLQQHYESFNLHLQGFLFAKPMSAADLVAGFGIAKNHTA